VSADPDEREKLLLAVLLKRIVESLEEIVELRY
jgi:hypothetical protein